MKTDAVDYQEGNRLASPYSAAQPQATGNVGTRLHPERFGHIFLLAVVVIVVVFFFKMIQPFLLPLLLAAVFTTLFYPLYARLLRVFPRRKSLMALAACMLLLLGLLIPVYLVGQLVSGQFVHFIAGVETKVSETLQQPDGGFLGAIQRSGWFQALQLHRLNWQAIFQNTVGSAGELAAGMISRTSGRALYVVANLFVTFFVMFYFFRDGQAIVRRVRLLLPMNDQYVERLISRFVTVSRATIKGVVVIGLIQSTIGGLTLWLAGVPSPVLWWLVMLILSMIPAFGAWMVMHPVALILIVTGHVWQGLGVFLVTVLVISTIDNVLRPRLVGHFTGLHDLLIFLSALGGIVMFGPMGVFVGPIVAAFFVTLLEIYGHEFRSAIHFTQRNGGPQVNPG